MTFSITTIASSTTTPTASTSANSDNRFIDIPKAFSAANVPIKDTGIVTHGTSVAIASPRNKNIITTTIKPVRRIVNSTSFIDSWIYSASSLTTRISSPLSSLALISLILALTAFERSRIFASESWDTIIIAAGLPFILPRLEYDCAPSSTLATSLSLTLEPSMFERIMIFSNSLTSASRPFVFRVN